jgi:hypothetical protein
MNDAPHLTQDVLIEHLYCGTDETVEHLRDCEECHQRFLEIERRLTELPMGPGVTAQFLQRQRRGILSRINAASTPIWMNIWVPASLAMTLAIGLLVVRTHRTEDKLAQPATEETAETLEILEPGWFAETSAAVQVAEPRAASPIVKLFAQQPVVE